VAGRSCRSAILASCRNAGNLLLSLHATSHDGALIVLTAAVVTGAQERRDWLRWVIMIWLLGASQLMIKQLGFSPGFPMLLIAIFWAWRATSIPHHEAVSRAGAPMPR